MDNVVIYSYWLIDAYELVDDYVEDWPSSITDGGDGGKKREMKNFITNIG